MYHAIIIGGISNDSIGRALGPYRLRTAAERHGYNVKVIDYAWALTDSQLLHVLSKIISADTKIFGISTSWFEPENNRWASEKFFLEFKKLFPLVEIVIGGTKSAINPFLKKYTSWFFTGFSDISFVKLLDYLVKGEPVLRHMRDLNNFHIKVVDSDLNFAVRNMDDIETIWRPEDNFKAYQPLTIEMSRGCIFKCAFCVHPFLGKKSFDYIRSPESIARELKRNYELFGTQRYMITDDTFNDSIVKLDRVRRAIDIAKIPNFEFTSYIRPELLHTKPEMIPILRDMGLRGAHIGLESLNHQARKVIGKGMDVNLVYDAVEKLNEGSLVKSHATIIMGLPDDTEEDFYKWNEFLLSRQQSLFRGWRYFALGINYSLDGDAYSLIEKDPAKFGYQVTPKPDSALCEWKYLKTGLTFEKCVKLSIQFNDDNYNLSKIGGWWVASAWYHNISDNDIENKTYAEIGMVELSKKNSQDRALEAFNRDCNE